MGTQVQQQRQSGPRSATTVIPARSRLLQRKCACGGAPGVDGQCTDCRGKRLGLQRQAVSAAGPATAPPIVHEVLRSPGQALDVGTRALMEPRFGYDFSRVRVHSDARAAESALAVNALAYTVGRDVVFGGGQYAPDTAVGQRLLAHELTHVVQQQGAAYGPEPIQMELDPGAWEAEAETQESGIHAQPSRANQHSLMMKRSGNASSHCGGGWTCCNSKACGEPDNKDHQQGPDSLTFNRWLLKVLIDVDVPTANDIMGGADVGHTFVELEDWSTGLTYTYGFYPRPENTPDEWHQSVNGCVAHPDESHRFCIDYTEVFELTKAEFDKALAFAQLYCVGPPNYELLRNNCTTFVEQVVTAAGKSLPAIRGKVAHGAAQADNPNTLLEGLQERDRKKASAVP